MNNPQEIIIYLDTLAFIILIAFFAFLVKSSSLFNKKKIMGGFNLRKYKDMNFI